MVPLYMILLKNPRSSFENLLCGCQAHYTRDLFFSFFFMTFLLPDQERLPAIRGTAHGRRTYSECAPL
jgi:hypothetical protein